MRRQSRGPPQGPVRVEICVRARAMKPVRRSGTSSAHVRSRHFGITGGGGGTMERNEFSSEGSTSGAADAVGAYGQSDNSSTSSGAGGSSSSGEAGGLTDRARDFAGVAK